MAASPFAPAHIAASSRCNRDKSSAETTVSSPAKTRALLHDVQLRLLVGHKRIRRHALHQENVPTDGAARADHGFAAEHGRIRVNGHLVLDRRMSFAALFDFAAFVFLKAARPKGDAMVQLHPGSDFTGLTDDDARAVIDKKVRADFRAGMNIDAGTAMRPLRQESRDKV